MSRSFGKSCKGHPRRRGWHRAMRACERMQIHREMFSADYGDVIFPTEREVFHQWENFYCKYLCLKKEIRDDYFTEIRNILNGYREWWDRRTQRRPKELQDYQKTFIDSFNGIKKGSPYRVKLLRYQSSSSFEWLNTREAKEAVKSWEGDPLDILHYMARSGVIEKAARGKCKRMARK